MDDKHKKHLALTQVPEAQRAFAMHDRIWENNRYVYPVVSRRSKGLSIGINLNPDKVCNFDCIYCSVDRKVPPVVRQVDLAVLETELRLMLQVVQTGAIYQYDPFDRVPAALRRVNDIAFSGDGEPTTYPHFLEVCQRAVAVRDALGLTDVKMVVITNATMFHRPGVQAALAYLDAHQGEIWAKLDAGTAAYYDLVDRTSVPFWQVLDNILTCCRARPTVIQSLFMRVHRHAPDEAEIEAYVGRLHDIIQAGGHITLVQAYTVARQVTEAYATALIQTELEAIAAQIHARLPGLPVEVYP